MSKGLETLKTIRHIHDMECGKDQSMDNAFDTIEKELKEYEQYKTTEKEFGINLLALIKALKNGIYSSFVDSSNKRIILKSNKVLLLKTLDGLDCFFEDNDERVLLFSDYSKTWALTKEELE